MVEGDGWLNPIHTMCNTVYMCLEPHQHVVWVTDKVNTVEKCVCVYVSVLLGDGLGLPKYLLLGSDLTPSGEKVL